MKGWCILARRIDKPGHRYVGWNVNLASPMGGVWVDAVRKPVLVSGLQRQTALQIAEVERLSFSARKEAFGTWKIEVCPKRLLSKKLVEWSIED